MATSPKQIDANRRNAAHSTGPRTEEGKARTSQNAVKHGLTAKRPILKGEDGEEYDRMLRALMEEFSCETMFEYLLVEQLAGVLWALRHPRMYEVAVLDGHNEAIHEWNKEHEEEARRHEIRKQENSRPPSGVMMPVRLVDPDSSEQSADQHRREGGWEGDSAAPAEHENQELGTDAETIEPVDSERAMRDYGHALVRDANMGDALGKISRHEIHLHNLRDRIFAQLQTLREKRLACSEVDSEVIDLKPDKTNKQLLG